MRAGQTCVPRRVDDVELQQPALGAGVGYTRDLRQYGNTALLLKIVAVHQTLADAVPGAERVALVQHGVDERRLAVIDVGDDGKVADGRGRHADAVECTARWCAAVGRRRRETAGEGVVDAQEVGEGEARALSRPGGGSRGLRCRSDTRQQRDAQADQHCATSSCENVLRATCVKAGPGAAAAGGGRSVTCPPSPKPHAHARKLWRRLTGNIVTLFH